MFATAVSSQSKAHEMLRAYEVLRAELSRFLLPKRVSELMDEACLAVDTEGSEDPMREMRAMIAARLLDQVGDFLRVTAMGPVAGPEPDDHPPYVGEDDEDQLPTRYASSRRREPTRDHRIRDARPTDPDLPS